jgi:predicted nucleic acid-binding protein
MANVINLNKHTPQKGERFFVDSNVWYWTTYVASREMPLPKSPREYQIQDYPAFLEAALDNGAELYHCPLTLAELANIIEISELDIFNQYNHDKKVRRKAYRNISAERKGVLKEIEVAWDAINAMSTCVEISLDLKFIQETQDILEKSVLDPYDSFFVQIMKKYDFENIITDDGDFCSFKGPTVFTSNNRYLTQ